MQPSNKDHRSKSRCFHILSILCFFGLAGAAAIVEPGATLARSTAQHGKAAVAFESFCDQWMEKLAAREVDNRSRVEWQSGSDGVQGEFVGYSHDFVCAIRPQASKKEPIVGSIRYRQLRYRQRGPNPAEAMQHDPEIVEVTELTEIFRYDRGKWVY